MKTKVILLKSFLTILVIFSLIMFLVPYLQAYADLAQLSFPDSDEANIARRRLESQMIAHILLASGIIGLTWLVKIDTALLE